MRKSSATTGISIAVLIALVAAGALVAQERRTGAISVKCELPDIQVFLDGVSRGRALLLTGVTAGNHQLVVLAPGMEAFVENVKVEPGAATQVDVRLHPLSGSVSVTTSPPGAEISIDRCRVGTSPVEVGEMTRGKHLITASLHGYGTREKEIAVEYGEELSIFLRMKKKEAMFAVFSFPLGADVFLDGKKVGVTPLKLKNVPPGQYALRVAKGEGCVHEETITVVTGKDLALDINLPVPGAVLSLDPGPEGRCLYLDERLLAELETEKISVPPGEHLVKITGWKGTLLCQRHMELEKGRVYQLALEPKFEACSQLKGHTRAVLALAFSRDGKTLASASNDGTVRLWDIGKGNELLSIQAHVPAAAACALDPQGKRIASGGWDKAVRIWDTSTGAKLREFGLDSAVQAVAWSPDGRYVAAGCANGTVKMWASRRDWQATLLRGHEDGARSLAFTPDGSILVSGGADGAVFLWKVADGSQIEKLRESSPLKAVVISGSGELLAAGREDGWVRVRRLDTLESVGLIKAQPNWVLSLAAGWGSVYAVGGDGGKITILNARAGRLLELGELGGPATALAFDRKGRYLAAGASSGIISLWIAE